MLCYILVHHLVHPYIQLFLLVCECKVLLVLPTLARALLQPFNGQHQHALVLPPAHPLFFVDC